MPGSDAWQSRIEAADDAGFEVRIAWRRNDAALQDDARRFWARERVLPTGVDPEARIPELMGLAYHDGAVVGVSTVILREVPFLRARFGMYRGAVAEASRRQRLARRLIFAAREVLEHWSLDNPQEKVMGMAAVSTVDFERAPGRTRPTTRQTRLQLVGYTDDDQSIRAYWFDHARL
jgi:hypothetical protein